MEGMQLIALFPLLKVNAPSTLAKFQAAMREVVTFELVDEEYYNIIWQFDGKEAEE
jgi:hypothetical protein